MVLQQRVLLLDGFHGIDLNFIGIKTIVLNIFPNSGFLSVPSGSSNPAVHVRSRRETKVLGRFGGDEFAVLLRNSERL